MYTATQKTTTTQ